MDKIKLSPYHKVFYNEWKIFPERCDYNIVFDQSIHGNLDIKRLSNALELLIKDHILFNSHLHEKNNHLYWESNISIVSLQIFKKSSRELQQKFVTGPFNLETGPLYRFGLFCTGKNKYDLILILHHILIDGKSMSKFIKLVAEYYQDQSLKNNLEIQKLEIEANNKALSEKVKFLRAHKSNHFWRSKLADLMPRNDIPYFKNQSIPNNKVSEYNFTLDKTLIFNKTFIPKLNFNSIIGIWGTLIARYSNSSIVHISYPINIAINNECLKYGAQINTSVLPIRLEPHTTYESLKNDIDNFVYLGSENPKARHFDLPIVEILGNSTVRELNVICAQINFKDITYDLADCNVKINHRYNVDIVGGEIALLYEDSTDKLKFRILYKLALFSEEFIAQIAKHFENLLIQSLKNPASKILENSLLTKEEYKTIVYKWNKTAGKYFPNKTIHQLFEEQVGKTPDNVAIKYKNRQLTYQELNKKANQLAVYIRTEYKKTSREELTPDTLIALCLDRSLELLVGILAVLKTGGAYVPIDPNYPQNRINFILEDTKAILLLLTQKQILQRAELCSFACKSLAIDLSNKKIFNPLESITTGNLPPQSKSNNLAYVIYTSGTTGKPKGVMIEHKAVNSLIFNNYVKVYDNDVFLLLASTTFDAATFEIWTPLLNGAKLIIPNNHLDLISNVKKFKLTLLANNVSILWLTKTLFDQLYTLDNTLFKTLNYLLVGGEALNHKLITHMLKNNNKPKHILNGYGPTEGTTFTCIYNIDQNHELSNSLPIGKPIQNRVVYILSNALQPVPLGVIGELYIGGTGLARGYLNQPELTKERFVVNPFQSKEEQKQNKNGKLYKTGDLCKYLADGNIEYIGRNDFQVKINGYRIELGEIESKLCQHKWLKQAIVYFQHHVNSLDMVTNHQSLVAYYELNDKYSDGDLVSYLQNWSEIYDDLYNNQNLENYNCNTSGWNSSYTLKPIPKIEMKEFIDNTVCRVGSLNPKNILEIGCGTGLILFNILNNCDKYIASDFSSVTIKHLNKLINQQNLENKVHTICCNAHELENINFEHQIDTVIINSVAQYFPNIDYLIDVLKISISKINDTGKIFIGDVRDYRLLELFHFSVLSYQNTQLNHELIDKYSKQDKELLISPKFFLYCKTLFNRIKHVDILPKRGIFDNEMNCFRYDVVLYINNKNENESRLDMQPIYSDNINSVLENTREDQLFVRYINNRIYKDYIEYNKLFGKHFPSIELLNIEQIYLLANNYGYQLKVLLDVENQILLNLFFYRGKIDNYHNDSVTSNDNFAVSEMTNNPIKKIGLSDSTIAESLEKYLLTQIPEYMVPKHYIKLPQIPLTTAGKIDYALLPPVKLINNHINNTPKNELEEKVASIWSDILGIPKEQIGVEDNFFKLGGNSFLIYHLKKKLSTLKEFAKIKVTDLFKYTTIQKLISSTTSSITSKTAVIKLTPEVNSKVSDIAIIGMSGAFSGGENLEEYWEQIHSGRSGLQKYSIDECRSLGVSEELLNNPDFVPVTGKIVGTTEFDAAFWDMSSDEVHNLDPQIRKFLEHCWYVLEDSGYLTDRSKFNIGVFAGGRNSPYSDHNMSRFIGQALGRFGAAGEINTTQSSLAMRISHILNLTGISNNINTACSSSLVAIIEACKNLANGSCDMAIAGGVSLILPSENGYIYQKGGIFSKNGESRIFDSESSGMISGSGVGVVLLKPLTAAEMDKDNIIAVIKGYAINNDGNRKMSYAAPSVVGQEECIIKAQKMANVLSNQIDYIECHGTGTMLGDAIEVQALSEVFKNNHDSSIPQHTCYIGSVKANIGHAELASGIAGLIKVCKMLKHNIIPKQINFEKCNPNINLSNQHFIIPTENIPWARNNTKVRIAGISSFGIGGTNAHVIISDYLNDQNSNDKIDHVNISNISSEPRKTSTIKTSYILPISAKTKLSLTKYKEIFINYLKNTSDNLANIAYTLQSKRESYTNRISIIADSIPEAIKKFEAVENITNTVIKNEKQDIVFMFPGQGAQYANMTLSLYQNSAKYRTILESCLLIVDEVVGEGLRQILFPELFPNEDALDKINQTQWSQIALFIVSYSLAKLLEEELNIVPSVYFGHSIGELVAATLSGVFQLNDAIKLVIVRGKLMQATPNGSMLQIRADYNILTNLIQANMCDIAVLNSPNQFVVAGTKENIAKLKAQLDGLSIPSILLKVSHGYHSYLMNDAANIFIDKFTGIKLYPPKHLFISNVTGTFIKDTEAIDPNYWSKHIKEKVLFMDGVKTIHKNFTNPFFIQIGPGKELLSFVKQNSVKSINGIAIINELSNITDDIMLKEAILSKFWESGFVINFNANYASNNVVHLPHYYFDNKEYNFQPNLDSSINNMHNSTQNELHIVEKQVFETGLPRMYYEIATIFIQLLELDDNLSIHDDFFDLGGNSLTALSLITNLKNIGIHLTLLDITHINTVSKIYTFANHINDQFSNKIITPLLFKNQERKIFFIHPIGGTVIQYLDIIKKLDSKYDYYGIQNINLLDSNALKAETFEDLCAIYLNEILQIQAGGEYIIMGSSIGGNIAYEISRQLIETGRIVKYIVMFDSWAQYFNNTYSVEDNMKVMLNAQKEKDNMVKTSVSHSTYNNLINSRLKLFHLFLKYQPKKSIVKIYLCKASEVGDEYIMIENSYDNFWQKYTNIPMTIYNISGNHETIHSEPGLSEITDCVNNFLK